MWSVNLQATTKERMCGFTDMQILELIGLGFSFLCTRFSISDSSIYLVSSPMGPECSQLSLFLALIDFDNPTSFLSPALQQLHWLPVKFRTIAHTQHFPSLHPVVSQRSSHFLLLNIVNYGRQQSDLPWSSA